LESDEKIKKVLRAQISLAMDQIYNIKLFNFSVVLSLYTMGTYRTYLGLTFVFDLYILKQHKFPILGLAPMFGLDRILVYSLFGLDRIPVYSRFGLYRIPIYSWSI
jgi:hypothetical protein